MLLAARYLFSRPCHTATLTDLWATGQRWETKRGTGAYTRNRRACTAKARIVPARHVLRSESGRGSGGTARAVLRGGTATWHCRRPEPCRSQNQASAGRPALEASAEAQHSAVCLRLRRGVTPVAWRPPTRRRSWCGVRGCRPAQHVVPRNSRLGLGAAAAASAAIEQATLGQQVDSASSCKGCSCNSCMIKTEPATPRSCHGGSDRGCISWSKSNSSSSKNWCSTNA
eukprot:365694-Chlamydomonas_euryale.AAC.5